MKQIDFYQRIAVVGEWIPYGKVATYGQIALLCGKPKNARQVGYGLRTDRCGKNFPAYRIVNSQGKLSGAAAFEDGRLQRYLLQDEGIEVTIDNQVDLKKYQWKHTIAEAEELYCLFKERGL